MKTVSPQELRLWMNGHRLFQLIDIREEWERELFNIGGIHIPMSELPERKDEISKSDDVVIYCEKGIRSSIIIQRLEGFGYHNLINLSGGMKAWREV
jgi:rhodanese-related sulfurtransferase